MELFENPGGTKMEDLLSEEPESHVHTSAAGKVNDDDFSVDSFEITEPKPSEEKKPEAKAAEVKQEPETTVRVEKETKKDPDGNVITKEVTVTEQSNKHSAFVNAFKPEMAIIFSNMLLERLGGIFWPDKPRAYWSISPQDRADLSVLMKESAAEGSWSGIPTKYLLMFIVVLIIGGKVYHANKPNAPGTGDQGADKNNPSGGGDPLAEAKRLIAQEKAREGAKNGETDLIVELKTQNKLFQEQNSLLKKLLDDKIKGAKSVPFEEIIDTPRGGGNIYKGYDLDVISFTKNGALIDPTKAGMKGFTSDGKRVGQPSKDILELWDVWKKHKRQHTEAA